MRVVILVVDSVALVRNNLERFLKTHGHDVLHADCGDAAYRILKSDQRVDLVVTELLIGATNAVELYQMSRNIERVGDAGESSLPKFVLFTNIRPEGNVSAAHLRLFHEAAALGFVDTLYKPLVREEFLQRIHEAVPQRCRHAEFDVRETVEWIRGSMNQLQNDLAAVQLTQQELTIQLDEIEDRIRD